MRIGDAVRVRGRRWLIAGVRPFGTCRLVTLNGAGPDSRDRRQRVLDPFDRIEAIAARTRPRFVSAARWRRLCASAVAAATVPGGLRTAARATIDLLPHQLEPAIAVVRGMATRLLLADAVGLGKTIQTGLILSELRARGAALRILVLTPAGLRDQWAGELAGRFGIHAPVVDARELRRRQVSLTPDVNPWDTFPTAVASLDFVKRPEVLAGVSAIPWDVVVIDEAHGSAIETERRHAVHTLSSRALYVLLLTATPHNGDESQFRALCALGGHGEPVVAFHRTRADVRLAHRRRVHRLRIRTSAGERRMQTLLTAFTRAVRAEHHTTEGQAWLALCVLHKRALSSAASLAASVRRRLVSLEVEEDKHPQLHLPLDDGDGEDSGDEPSEWPAGPVLANAGRERELLTALLKAAELAARDESKLRALVRLLRRIGEPAVVFTEYRDTLACLHACLGEAAVLLHGGLSRAERAESIGAFTSGRARWILATDAAGEGLNLHARCRVVINLELPWNPVRLEQRIGRVDRIGQQRPVHAFHFVGAAEAPVLRRLDARLARAQASFGAPDPLGPPELDIALAVLGETSGVKPPAPVPGPAAFTLLRLEAEASAEMQRLVQVRRVARAGRHGAGAIAHTVTNGAPSVAFARNCRTRARLGGRALQIWELACEDDSGVEVERAMVPLMIVLSRSAARSPLSALDALASDSAAVMKLLLDLRAAWFELVIRHTGAFRSARLTRARSIAAAWAPVSGPIQAGLFDHRAERSDPSVQPPDHALRVETASSRPLRLRDPILLLALVPKT